MTRDTQINGNLINNGPLVIGRNLLVAGSVYNADSLWVGGELSDLTTAVIPPCPCTNEEILDIATIVDISRHDNQNEEMQLASDSLASVNGVEDLHLACGRYYLDRVVGNGTVTIDLEGPTALFVGGNFALDGDLNIILEESGRLDVFVNGDLDLTGLVDSWGMTKPSDIRFYVGGNNEITLTNVSGFNLYAPRARVTAPRGGDVYGSIFAREFRASDDTRIHVDQDTLKVGQNCGEDKTGDEQCVGFGDSCEEDEACCVPLSCINNLCQSTVFVV